MKSIVKKPIYKVALVIFVLSQIGFAQVDTVENYFPTKVGTTWVYRLYPDFSKERERVTITKETISVIDGSRLVFVNGNANPKYRIDTLGNVYDDPLGTGMYSNTLIFKQKANKFEAWAFSDSIISGAKRVARIKEIGYSFLFGKAIKYKQVEWGEACEKCSPDSFGLSPISKYYGSGFGLYFVIVEPPQTERVLVGFISNGDTLGNVTKVIDIKDTQPTFILHQNFPNPFNSTTAIIYELKSEQTVTIKIIDVLGREVQEIVHQQQPAGQHKVHFNADGLQTGMYLLQLRAGDFVQVKKLLYLK